MCKEIFMENDFTKVEEIYYNEIFLLVVKHRYHYLGIYVNSYKDFFKRRVLDMYSPKPFSYSMYIVFSRSPCKKVILTSNCSKSRLY